MPTATPDDAASKTLLTSIVRVELPKLGGSVATGIEQEIDEYRADTTGRVHDEVRRAVGVAVRAFVDALDTSDHPRSEAGETYREAFRRLGRLEAQAGRSHDTLQAAYRSAERQILSWISDRSAELSIDDSARRALIAQVAAFISQLAGLSAEGFADAQNEHETEGKFRDQLLGLLLRESVPRRTIDEAAARVGWRVPIAVRVLEFVSDVPVALVGLEARSGLTMQQCVLGQYGTRTVGIVEASTDLTGLRNAVPAHVTMAIGPSVPVGEARFSARIACRAARRAKLRNEQTVHCDTDLLSLLGPSAEEVMHVLATGRLQPLARFSIEKRVKLGKLLSAWLEHGTLHADVPGVLDKSRHTLRYQIAQLETLFGPCLTQREDRVELILALRSALPQWEAELGAAHRRKNAKAKFTQSES